MPKFKTVEFSASNDAGAVDKFTVSVEIRANGTFYAHVPDKLRVSFKDEDIDHRERQRKGFFPTSALTYHELFKRIEKAHKEFMRPTEKVEKVIRFNIESHVSFAITKDGRIFPNAGYEGAEWPHRDKEREDYGDHDANNPAERGYSLTIGAKAMLKKTTTYGEQSKVTYSYYYGKKNDHFSKTDPAARLNSWCSIDLPEDAREMPYSDEAAVFFFNLLQTMAELNRRIQEFTNTPEKIARAIAGSSGALLLAGPEKKR